MASLGYKLSKTTLFSPQPNTPSLLSLSTKPTPPPPFFKLRRTPPLTIFSIFPLQKLPHLRCESSLLLGSVEGEFEWWLAVVSGGATFRRREAFGVKRKVRFFLNFLMLFFLFYFIAPFPKLLILFQFDPCVCVCVSVAFLFSPAAVGSFPAKGVVVKVGDSFSSSFW